MWYAGSIIDCVGIPSIIPSIIDCVGIIESYWLCGYSLQDIPCLPLVHQSPWYLADEGSGGWDRWNWEKVIQKHDSSGLIEYNLQMDQFCISEKC